MSRKKPNWWVRIGAALLAAAVVIQLLATQFDAYGAPLRRLGRFASALVGRIFSVAPFPVAEWLLLGLPVAIIVTAVVLFRRHGLRGGGRRLLSRLLLLLGVVAFGFVLGLGVQYGAPDLDTRLGLPRAAYSTQQLQGLTEYLLDRANTAAAQVPRDDSGRCDFGDYRAMAGQVMSAYRTVANGGAYYRTVTAGAISPAAPKKTLLLGKAMSYLGISGFYFPWTGEAVVSSDTPDVMLPVTVAHEAAHTYGVANEDAANFVAVLTCADTRAAQENPAYAYSTWFLAYRYASNALYAADYNLWAETFAGRSTLLMFDMAEYQAHLDQYATPVREVGTAVNDTYIKATGQPAGVRSYGKVVDLMLSWYVYGNCG